MNDSIPELFLWMERLVSVAVVLQTLEYFQIRNVFDENGIWPWRLVGREFSMFGKPVQALFSALLSTRGFSILLALRLALAVEGLIQGSSWLWLTSWVMTLLIAMRWRGTFNGGSDSMTLIVLGAAFVGRGFGADDQRWMALAMGYVAVQVCLSFFISGLAKLCSSKWRSGEALVGFLSSDYYGFPRGRAFLKHARILTVCVLAFECAFPLALIDPRICILMIGGAILFQLGNAVFLGLNRFVWAWGAAYPALYWCSLYLSK